MRSYSFFTIILLCLALLIVDILAFYWLRSITQLITSQVIIHSINIAFWFFTIGLIFSIVLLKSRLETINPKRTQLLISSLYGLAISSFIPKLIFVIIITALYFTNYVFLENESLILVPLQDFFQDFFLFLLFVMAFLELCTALKPIIFR